MSFGCLFDIINEFRGTEPTLFTLNFPICRGPADLSAEHFKVRLGLIPLFLLHRVSELSVGELIPQSFNSSQVGIGNIFHVREVNKIAAFCLCARDFDQSISSELSAVAIES